MLKLEYLDEKKRIKKSTIKKIYDELKERGLLYQCTDEDALKNPDWAFYKKFLNKETSILEGDCHIKYFLDMTHLGLSKIFFLLKSDCKKIYYSKYNRAI